MLATLLSYLAYCVASGDVNGMVCVVGSDICFAATLIPTMGIQYKSSRLGTNIRIFSAIFFVIFAVSHFCFAGFGLKIPYYIIVNGIILLIYLAIFYKLQGIKEI